MDVRATGSARLARTARGAFTVAAAAALFTWLVSPAVAAPFADATCPAATQPVLAIGHLPPGVSKQTLYDGLQAAVDAYTACEGQRRDRKDVEAMHYAQLRAAQFGVVSAHLLVALHRDDDARRALLHYRDLAQSVVEWRRSAGGKGIVVVDSSQRSSSTNPDVFSNLLTHTAARSPLEPSAYQSAAQNVVDAANELLARIDPGSAASDGASPAPH